MADCLHGDWITHPYFLVRYWKAGDNRRINHLFDLKRAKVLHARKEQNWDAFFGLHHPRHREEAFLENCEQMNKLDYYRVAGNIWTDPEIIHSGSCFVAAVYRKDDDINDRRNVMNDQERDAFDRLPQRIEVFRAHEPWNRDGCCWTRLREIAEEFAIGYEWPCITRGSVARDDVIGYFQRRGEEEVVAAPSCVRVDETTEVTGSN